LASYDLYWEINEAAAPAGTATHSLPLRRMCQPRIECILAPNRGAGSRDSREDSVRPRELPLRTIRWSRHSRSMDPILPRPAAGVVRA